MFSHWLLPNFQKRLATLLALLLAACGAFPGALERDAALQKAEFQGGQNPAFALEFPAGWGHQATDSGIMLSNNPGLLESVSEVVLIPSGALVADFTVLRRDHVRDLGARNAADLLDAYVGQSDRTAAYAYSRAEPIEIAGRAGGQSIVKSDQSDNLLLALALEDTYALGIVVAPAGELGLHLEALKPIIASVRLKDGG